MRVSCVSIAALAAAFAFGSVADAKERRRAPPERYTMAGEYDPGAGPLRVVCVWKLEQVSNGRWNVPRRVRHCG